jgi:hypothetical protein
MSYPTVLPGLVKTSVAFTTTASLQRDSNLCDAVKGYYLQVLVLRFLILWAEIDDSGRSAIGPIRALP